MSSVTISDSASPARQPLSTAEPHTLNHRATGAPRLASVDAYRGLIIFLMLAEVLRSCTVAAALPASMSWALLCREQTHAAWSGFSLHDLIQPGFYFLVGVGTLLSVRRRRMALHPTRQIIQHTAVRAVTLIVLGMVLNSLHPRRWTWEFNDTLTQIGLAYPFVVAAAFRPRRDWVFIASAILTAYWVWFALSPLPSAAFDYTTVGVSKEWLTAHGLTGFATHWQKNTNVAAEFDRWFVNLFPLDDRFVGLSSGLTTLNFVPSIATMMLGLFACDVLRNSRSAKWRISVLWAAGLALIGSGWMLDSLGICPVVKAIWTPSWVLFSGGFCFLFLAAFYLIVDVVRLRLVALPLIVFGTNSILAYAMFHLHSALAFNLFRRALGPEVFEVLGIVYAPLVYGCMVLTVYWLVLYTLYTRRIMLRI